MMMSDELQRLALADFEKASAIRDAEHRRKEAEQAARKDEHAIWMASNSPAKRRDWQVWQAATALMGSVLAAGNSQDVRAIYDLAEAMMKERERRGGAA